MGNNVLVLGGAGFIGSHLAEVFVNAGNRVTVIDGLLKSTGGARQNIAAILSEIVFIDRRIEEVRELLDIVQGSDLVVDAMAWTAHRSGMANPRYDLELNVSSHLWLLESLRNLRRKRVIYLGSRGQYGRPEVQEVTEQTPMVPQDVQGIHKLAAEMYFRVFSTVERYDVASLRIPNCYGERQPVSGEDIGLVGGFIREMLQGKTVTVFGVRRRRDILYVRDLANIVLALSQKGFSGFVPLNIAGSSVTIEDLAACLVGVIGKGSYVVREIPDSVRAVDWGEAGLREDPLEALIGPRKRTGLTESLERTVVYFREALHDLAL